MKLHSIVLTFVIPALAVGAWSQSKTEPVELKARLLAPISTKTSNAQDRFTATVDSPQQYQGAILEGRVTSVNAPSRGIGKGKPAIGFQFETITVGGVTSKIAADLTDVSNSRGVKGVDEEGRAIGKTSNKKRVLAGMGGAGLGALVGGLTHGAAGAIGGAVIGGAAGIAIGLTMTTAGEDIEFFPGSVMILSLTSIKH